MHRVTADLHDLLAAERFVAAEARIAASFGRIEKAVAPLLRAVRATGRISCATLSERGAILGHAFLRPPYAPSAEAEWFVAWGGLVPGWRQRVGRGKGRCPERGPGDGLPRRRRADHECGDPAVAARRVRAGEGGRSMTGSAPYAVDQRFDPESSSLAPAPVGRISGLGTPWWREGKEADGVTPRGERRPHLSTESLAALVSGPKLLRVRLFPKGHFTATENEDPEGGT